MVLNSLRIYSSSKRGREIRRRISTSSFLGHGQTYRINATIISKLGREVVG